MRYQRRNNGKEERYVGIDRSCALYPQVLLKACAYTQERHVFGDIFFCRVDKDVDACRWLEVSKHSPWRKLHGINHRPRSDFGP